MILMLTITCPFTGRRTFDTARGDIIMGDISNGLINVNPKDYAGGQVAFPLHAVLAISIEPTPKLEAVAPPSEAVEAEMLPPTPIRKPTRKKKE